MAEHLPYSRDLRTVFSTAEQEARLRKSHTLDSWHLLLGVGKLFPQYLENIGVDPKIPEGIVKTFSLPYPSPSPDNLLLTPRSSLIIARAASLARQRRIELVNVGLFIEAYFIDESGRGNNTFAGTGIEPTRVVERIQSTNPFDHEPKSVAEELLRDLFDES